jgi:hypothetical protein
MKQLSTIFLSIVFACVITSCQKQPKITETMPIAYFTSDKATYTAGDVIHLKSNATNAYTYKWTMPDGSIQTTQNIELVTDSDDVAGSKTFSLEVTSKSGVKSKIFTKKFTLQEYILTTDYYFNGFNTIKPTFKICRTNVTYWYITAGNGSTRDLGIHLYGNTLPTQSRIYNIKPFNSTLINGEATISITQERTIDGFTNAEANSGQLFIQITNTGKIRAIFNNINAKIRSDPGGGGFPDVTISGDITCH